MPSIGPLELGIVLLIVLVVFGPKRLPGLGRQLGSGKDRDDDEDATDETRARHELDPAPGTPSESGAVTGQARTEDRAATRSDP